MDIHLSLSLVFCYLLFLGVYNYFFCLVIGFFLCYDIIYFLSLCSERANLRVLYSQKF